MKLPLWLIESGKEFLRVVVLAILPVLISGIQENLLDWRLIATVAAVAGLRFIDSALHEYNKEQPLKDQNAGILGEKGITGF